MKRIFSSVMALGLATTLAACGGNTNQPADNTANEASTETTEVEETTEDAAEETADDAATTDDAETEDDAEETDDTDDTAAEDEEDNLTAEDKADLENFDNVTADDTLVIGSPEMNGDWISGWSNSSYDVRVRKLMGIQGNNGYSTVVQDEGGQWVNNPTVLAEDPEVVDNEDGSRTITYKINQDLKWSDGTPINADNYLYGALLYSHPSYIPVTASTSIGADSLKGYAEYHDASSDVDFLEGQKKIDDYSFSVTIDESFLPYFEEAALSAAGPFPLHAISENLTINEDGTKLVAKEGYEPTEEEINAYKESIQTQIDKMNEDFDANNEAPAEDADEEEKAAYDEAKAAHDEEVAKLSARLEGDIDPTQQLIEQAMLKLANEYRFAPTVVEGPYKFESFENNMVRLSLNENYAGNFKGEKATIPNIIVQTVNSNIAADLLENGDIDIWEDEATGGRIDQMRAAADEGKIKYNTFERNGYGNLTFITDRGATKHKEVRQAIANLMDRNTFVQSFAGGYGVVTNGMYGLSQWMYQERGADLEDKLTNYQLNLDTANELLDASPYKFEADGTTPWDKAKADEAFSSNPDGYDYWRYDENGKKLVVNQFGSDESEITTLISNQLPNNAKQVGMEYNVTAGAFPTLLNYYYNPEEDAEYTAFNMGSSFGTPFDPWYSLNSEGPNNYTKTNDPRIDELTVKLRQTDPTDVEGYLDTWEEFQLAFNDYLPEIPLYSNQYHTGYTNRVQGFELNTPVWGAADQINAMTLGE